MNNIFQSCPAMTNDSRFLTDNHASDQTESFFQSILGSSNEHSYRDDLQKNAVKLIKGQMIYLQKNHLCNCGSRTCELAHVFGEEYPSAENNYANRLERSHIDWAARCSGAPVDAPTTLETSVVQETSQDETTSNVSALSEPSVNAPSEPSVNTPSEPSVNSPSEPTN